MFRTVRRKEPHDAARPRRRTRRFGPAFRCAPSLVEEAAHILERAYFEIKRVVSGQDQMVERVLTALLARGHVLLEGLPGLAQTLTVRTVAQVFGGEFKRIQFTADLVPAVLVGTRVLEPGKATFRVELVNFSFPGRG